MPMNNAWLPDMMDWDDGYTQDVQISDPETCGEDLVSNAQQAIRFAPILCGDCRTYHVGHTMRRVVRPQTSIRSDRAEMIGFVGEIVRSAAASSPGPIRIVIPGAADTGILATCAHAVALLGPATAARVSYSVIDLCMTPLALCEAYGRRHGIAVELHRADLCSLGLSIPADLIVLHSILSYLPQSQHIATIEELRSWLNPQGRILVSNRIRLAERRRPPDQDIVAAYVDRCRKQGVRCQPAQVLHSYLTQPNIFEAEFMHWDDIADLLASGGLTIEREFRITREPRPPRPGERCAEAHVAARYIAIASAGAVSG
jgi:hypothetical protein